MAERKVAPIGAKTMLGFGLQPDAETAVEANILAEYRNGAFEGNQSLLFSEALLDSPSPRRKSVVGDFSGEGSFNMEVTPRKAFPLMLTAILGEPTEVNLSPNTVSAPTLSENGTAGSTTRKYYIVAVNSGGYPSVPSAAGTITDSAATLNATDSVTVSWSSVPGATKYHILRSEGSGSSVATAKRVGTVNSPTVTFTDEGAISEDFAYTSSPISKKTWKHGWDRKWLTAVQKKGSSVQVFPFVAVHGLSIRVDRGQREVITASISAKAGNMGVFSDTGSTDGEVTAAMEATGLDTATYDSLPPFSPAKAKVKIANVGGSLVAATHIKGASFNLDRNTADEYCLNGKLGPQGFVDGISGLDMSFESYFKSGAEADLKRFMGNASTVSSSGAYGFQGVVKEVSVAVLFPYPSGLGFDSELEIVFPRCAYGAVGVPVGGRGEPLMQSVRVEPIYDGTESTDVLISIISNEPKSTIMADTNDEITMPTNAVQ